MNQTDDIADVACALRKRTARPSVWGEKLKEAERKTRASFVSVFGGSSQDAPKPTSTASAQNADDGAGQAAKEPQVATAEAQGANDAGNGVAAPEKEVQKPVQANKPVQAKRHGKKKGGRK